jgi:2-polyprenyl-3-methyl-5-hydroxy-6-metoxy-1,4-benzoquinol methylase
MRDVLRKFLDESGSESPGLISVGCGNAAVEAGLVTAGYRVAGVDAMEEAISLARQKGVEVECADVFKWTPPPGNWRVVYADGFLGHVFDPDQGLQPVLERMRSWLPPGNGALVISNDDPRTDADTQPHAEVPAFTWLSGQYLKAQAEKAGFKDVWSTWFTYERPISGPRERVIVTARS